MIENESEFLSKLTIAVSDVIFPQKNSNHFFKTHLILMRINLAMSIDKTGDNELSRPRFAIVFDHDQSNVFFENHNGI